ncbi:HAD family hydrolase [Ectobacillus ponti]|uniref:HAD family hydrolase n=1 Tax=Ectobacillus ponti TaxID=2961894 RepID=A0AA41X4D2_9BACI|nr:HAD family hydrolase [Ectobacillus ponti]MCP8968706.1 HAD family hydrolase [Ectobacillus ponti]
MKQLVEACKVLIFDLDGTLYEGTEHYDYYAEQIKQELPADLQPLFVRDYEEMKLGKHALSIGKVYDMEQDAILTLDPLAHTVVEVQTWTGQTWSDGDRGAAYPGQIVYDETRYIAVGDGWWLPYVTGAHYGAKDTYHCYNKTKDYMSSPQFHLPKTPGLREALAGMKGEKTLVLLTNSDGPDVRRLLRGLELADIFDMTITDALKPFRTAEHLQHIVHTYGVRPDEVVSIGDNFINELAPALKLGMHAVYIAPHGGVSEYENFLIVPTLAHAFA